MESIRIRKDPFKSLENFSLIHVEFYIVMPLNKTWIMDS